LVKDQSHKPFGLNNEKNSWKLICQICEDELKQYPSTFEEDEKILEEDK
jgi:hypothetical protein